VLLTGQSQLTICEISVIELVLFLKLDSQKHVCKPSHIWKISF